MKGTKTIFISGLTAGTLDAVAAVLLYVKPVNLHNSSRIFRYIASGLFGKAAYETGPLFPITGLILHYMIATLWSFIYLFILHHVFKFGAIWVKIILFASLIWVIMNGFVVPLSGLTSRPDGWAIMRSFTVILICVSLPICLITEKRK
jgi:hypothetical protein